MKVIWDQLIEAAITLQIFNQNITDQPSMKRRIFWSVFFTVFLDCRSTNLLRLFSGNLPAMFWLSSWITCILKPHFDSDRMFCVPFISDNNLFIGLQISAMNELKHSWRQAEASPRLFGTFLCRISPRIEVSMPLKRPTSNFCTKSFAQFW